MAAHLPAGSDPIVQSYEQLNSIAGHAPFLTMHTLLAAGMGRASQFLGGTVPSEQGTALNADRTYREHRLLLLSLGPACHCPPHCLPLSAPLPAALCLTASHSLSLPPGLR